MAKGITKKEPDPRVVYADIIGMPHWQSPKHPHMSLWDRAAQFASYKALTGYEDMIAEEARFTDREIGLEEHALEVLNRKLQRIAELVAAGQSPALTFTVFVPDASKDGGSYAEVTDRVKRIDEAAGEVVLMSKRERSGVRESIPLARIVEIRGEAVDGIAAE